MNSSLDFWVNAPRGNNERFGTQVGRTASVQFNPCISASDKPGSEDNPNRVWSTPLRKSASAKSTREPVFARAIARLAEVRDLPSLGTELVTSNVRGRSPDSAIYSKEERRLR